jgi:hypothetical protein
MLRHIYGIHHDEAINPHKSYIEAEVWCQNYTNDKNSQGFRVFEVTPPQSFMAPGVENGSYTDDVMHADFIRSFQDRFQNSETAASTSRDGNSFTDVFKFHSYLTTYEYTFDQARRLMAKCELGLSGLPVNESMPDNIIESYKWMKFIAFDVNTVYNAVNIISDASNYWRKAILNAER